MINESIDACINQWIKEWMHESLHGGHECMNKTKIDLNEMK